MITDIQLTGTLHCRKQHSTDRSLDRVLIETSPPANHRMVIGKNRWWNTVLDYGSQVFDNEKVHRMIDGHDTKHVSASSRFIQRAPDISRINVKIFLDNIVAAEFLGRLQVSGPRFRSSSGFYATNGNTITGE